MKPSDIIYSHIKKAMDIKWVIDDWNHREEQNMIAIASIIKYLDEQYELENNKELWKKE